MFKVQNSQHYLNKMTFESICDVLFVQEGICERIENYFSSSNFQSLCLEVSFRGLYFEKMHTTLYLYYFIFWNHKSVVRKKV